MNKKNVASVLWGMILLLMSVSSFALRAATLSGEEVKRAVKDYIVTSTGIDAKKLIVEFKHALPAIQTPPGQIDLKVSGRIKEGYTGRVAFKVDVYVDGRLYRTLYPAFEIDYLVRAFMARRWINRGEKFGPYNVFAVEMRKSLLPPRAVTSMEQLRGKIARVGIPKGRVVTLAQAEKPPVIRRGQIVTLKVDAPGLKVEAKGEALTDGRKGESIKVKNVDSGKVLYGRVRDDGTVVVSLP